ncbi:unnamed protein product [Heligmosomoides polygyrus]|uniref:Adaptin_N domain-containing protein n=1 Tax=Heligmosomoides polygyrus TaxID=6339 RepID=A0A183G1J4_HELPZ|nr:unnamed protein product [Heligmosomoides polygyrus]
MSDSGQEFYIEGLSVIVRKTGSSSSLSKDQTIFLVLKNFLVDDRVFVVTCLVKMFLYLSENADDAIVLSNVAGPEESLSAAAENSFPPNMVDKILTLVSRTKSVQDRAARPREVISNAIPPCEGRDPDILSSPRLSPRPFLRPVYPTALRHHSSEQAGRKLDEHQKHTRTCTLEDRLREVL